MNRKSCWSAVWGTKLLAQVILILTTTLASAQTSAKLSPDLQAALSSTSTTSSSSSSVSISSSTAASSGSVSNTVMQSSSSSSTSTSSNSTVNIVVQYAGAPNQANYSAAAAAGATLTQQYSSFQGAAYSIPLSGVNQLVGSDPTISYISLDRPLAGATDYGDGAVATNLDIARNYGFDGSGIGIAVIDSGISSHDDLKGANTKLRTVYSQNFVPGASSASDAYGHGTHVAGIMGGMGAKSKCSNCTITFLGVAPNVKLVNLRVLDQNGQGTDSAVIAAIDRAIALKNTYNIRVINLSLGRGVYESYTLDPLCQAVEAAWKAGVVVVVAAGNYGRNNSFGNQGYGTITSPGNDPYVITVGAMKTMSTDTPADDQIATYSSKGPTAVDHIVKPDIVAPGNQRVSLLASTSATIFANNSVTAVPKSYYQNGASNVPSSDYYRLSGTSMATPEVSGTVALILQQNPLLAPDQVKARLMKTASKSFPVSSTYTDPTTNTTYVDYYDIFTVGAGYLNIAGALSNTDQAPSTAGSAMSPTAVYNSSTGTVTLVDQGSNVIWGGSLLWGTSVIWGNSVSGNSILWGSSVSGNSLLWGTSATAESIMWGSSVLWGSSIMTNGE